MPMYRGGNEMLSAFAASNEICFGYVNGVRVFNCDQGPTPFVPMILTVHAKASENYDFNLELHVGWNYNFVVNWGDGLEDTITTYNDLALTHVYPSMDLQYTVTITGLCEKLSFGPSSFNKFLLLDVTQWGYTGLTNTRQMYGNGTINCAFTATDAGGTQKVVDMGLMFNSLDVNPYIDEFDVGKCADFSSFMNGSINANPDLSNWDMRSALTIENMLEDCTSYLGTGIGNWVTTKLQVAGSAFRNCVSLDQDISGWNISELGNCARIFEGTSFSRTNYDALLIAWAAQAPNVQSSVGFHAGNAQYTTGGAAEAGRDLLQNTYGWMFDDGGPAP